MNFAAFEPNYTVLTYLFVQKFVYLEVLALLAVLRLIVGRGWARLPAGLALVLALAGIATVLAPMAGLNSGPAYVRAAQTMAMGGGLAALLVPSAVFALGLFSRTRRWVWIDWAHLAGVAAFLGLWLATRL